MSTTTINKTAGTSVISHQAITHPDTVKSSAIDVSTKLAATLFLFWASVEAAANTNAGSFLIFASAASSGDEDWTLIRRVITPGGTAATEAMTATEPVAETVLACASTTGFAAGDVLYVQDTGTLADSEWNWCQEIVTNTSINLLWGLTNQKDNADVIWNAAMVAAVELDLSAISRLMVVFQHEGATGANGHIKATMVSADSLSTT